MRIYWFIFVIVFWSLVPPVFAQDETPQETFNQSNTAYLQGRLEEAEAGYSQLVNQGFQSGFLYYNLGNTYYRLGNLGKAIQYYHKALRVLPRDSDLRANLEFIQKKGGDQLSQSGFWVFINNFIFWSSYFTLSEMIILTVICSSLFWFSFLAFYLLKKKMLKTVGLFFLVLFLYIGFAAWVKYDSEVRQKWGVITVSEVEVHPSFIEKEKSILKLPEGTVIPVIGTQRVEGGESWLQIELPGNKKGWVLSDEVGLI